MLKALFALVAAALFAGAALYVSFVEHPARMRLREEGALAQWKASYARAAPIQATLALLSLALGAWTWWKTDEMWMLIGALAIGAAVLLTLAVILPVTRRLKATAVGAAGADTTRLLDRWAALHHVRTLLGLGAVAAYLIAILWP